MIHVTYRAVFLLQSCRLASERVDLSREGRVAAAVEAARCLELTGEGGLALPRRLGWGEEGVDREKGGN